MEKVFAWEGSLMKSEKRKKEMNTILLLKKILKQADELKV